MDLDPYITFNGDCEAAFRFYEQALGGKIEAIFRHEDTPAKDQVPPEWRSKIMHARIVFGPKALMGSDAPPGRYEPPKGFSITIATNDPTEAERVYKSLSEGGEVRMPLQETFWAHRFAMLVDRFGIPWTVNCEKPA